MKQRGSRTFEVGGARHSLDVTGDVEQITQWFFSASFDAGRAAKPSCCIPSVNEQYGLEDGEVCEEIDVAVLSWVLRTQFMD